jgi:diaminohydroxyphosphoribosylaminopyrimidine deaminase / 5-amino-6-(5-phosphoribosylamino)uracil reductase
MSASDEDHMAQALALARRGLGTTWPNPSVGCVVVSPSGEIVGRGFTAPGGRPHAEAVALDRAGNRAAGATIYVTLEPCAHEGRGAACADVIAAAHPARAVIAMADPDPRTAGHGLKRLRDAGIAVTEGVLQAEALAVTLGHVLRITEGRPAVTLKLAVGSDGLVPRGQHGTPTWVTGELARAHAHLLRARSDAILVGRGTIIADNPSLTCRLPGMDCRSPVRVVLDRRLRTPADARLFEDEMVPVWFICTAEEEGNASALHERGAEIIPVGIDDHGLLDLKEALVQLAKRGITRLLVEGGPSVAQVFIDAGLVDEAVIYQGATPAGSDGLLPFVSEGLDRLTNSSHFSQIQARDFGPDRMTWWQRKRKCLPALSAT